MKRRAILAALAVGLAALAALRLWPAPDAGGPSRPRAVPATRFPQHDVLVDGLRIRAIDVGPPDAPVVLILPGHTSRIEEYDALVPTLSRSLRTIVFDFPGSGYSDKPRGRYAVADYEDFVVAFMDAQGIPRAHLAGGSLGANVLLGVAARHPDRFDRLAPWSPGSAWQARPRLAAAGRWLVAGYWPFRLSVAIQSTYWYRDDFPGREAALRNTFLYYDEVMEPGFVDMYWGLGLDTLARSLFDVVGSVSHPVQLSYGGLDATPEMQTAVPALHALLPRSELVFHPQASHALATEMPERLAEQTLEFLLRPEAELPAPPATAR